MIRGGNNGYKWNRAWLTMALWSAMLLIPVWWMSLYRFFRQASSIVSSTLRTTRLRMIFKVPEPCLVEGVVSWQSFHLYITYIQSRKKYDVLNSITAKKQTRHVEAPLCTSKHEHASVWLTSRASSDIFGWAASENFYHDKIQYARWSFQIVFNHFICKHISKY